MPYNTSDTIMLALQYSRGNPVKISSLVPVEGNKSLPLICSPAELVGPISRLLSWCPLKPQHCMSYLGLISVCPPREGSMAAGPSPTLDRPLLGSPLQPCCSVLPLSLPLTFCPCSLLFWMSWHMHMYMHSNLPVCNFVMHDYNKAQNIILYH